MAARADTARDLRERCVEQAIAIIAENGIEALSLRDVARRLNVSHQAPYKHFPSRDHILAEVLKRTFGDFTAYLQRRIRGHQGPDAMRQLGLGYLAYAREHPLHYQLMFATPLPQPDAHPEMVAEAKRSFGLLCAALEALPGRRGSDVIPDALFIWSTLHGLASVMKTCIGREIGLTDRSIPAMSKHVLDMIGRAIGARVNGEALR